MKIIINLVFLLGVYCASFAQTPVLKQQKLPGVTFSENRVFLWVPVQGEQRLKFYTDTGGGRILAQSAVQKMNLTPDTSFMERGKNVQIVSLAKYFKNLALPAPVAPHMAVGDMPMEEDGMLGSSWFANKVWNFDYVNKTLSLVNKIEWGATTKHQVKLGFQKNKQGQKTTHFPRIPIIVEGDTLQMLFDTGAMAHLSSEAQKTLGKKAIGASFIVQSIFNKWTQKHPEWQVMKKGDVIWRNGRKLLEADMIQVPKVTIAGHTVGPVWFASRKEANFTQWMSKWMDRTIVGAIGGSCFQYFKTLVVDYNQERAYFER